MNQIFCQSLKQQRKLVLPNISSGRANLSRRQVCDETQFYKHSTVFPLEQIGLSNNQHTKPTQVQNFLYT